MQRFEQNGQILTQRYDNEDDDSPETGNEDRGAFCSSVSCPLIFHDVQASSIARIPRTPENSTHLIHREQSRIV